MNRALVVLLLAFVGTAARYGGSVSGAILTTSGRVVCPLTGAFDPSTACLVIRNGCTGQLETVC